MNKLMNKYQIKIFKIIINNYNNNFKEIKTKK